MPETLSFICPVCGSTLNKSDKAYVCANRHSFDISGRGYVNLLLSHKMSSKEPGDSKQMVLARNAFLATGLYSALSDAINTAVLDHIHSHEKAEGCTILDAGCGEGYYTDRLERALRAGGTAASLFGIDLSRDTIKLAAARNRNICFAVANSFEIPLADRSADCLLMVFAPCSNDEFSRVLKDDGILISVIPGKRHLFGLKELLYDNPYENDEAEHKLPSFVQTGQTHIAYDISIEEQASIQNLLMMTPYYWRTNIQKRDSINGIGRLDTPVEFVLSTYAKRPQ